MRQYQKLTLQQILFSILTGDKALEMKVSFWSTPEWHFDFLLKLNQQCPMTFDPKWQLAVTLSVILVYSWVTLFDFMFKLNQQTAVWQAYFKPPSLVFFFMGHWWNLQVQAKENFKANCDKLATLYYISIHSVYFNFKMRERNFGYWSCMCVCAVHHEFSTTTTRLVLYHGQSVWLSG